jgi:hypothetical protein
MYNPLFARAFVAFLLLPGTVALLVPFLLAPRNEAFNLLALIPLLAGLALLCGAFAISTLPARARSLRGHRLQGL